MKDIKIPQENAGNLESEHMTIAIWSVVFCGFLLLFSVGVSYYLTVLHGIVLELALKLRNNLSMKRCFFCDAS